jgi:hypothetical protein
MRKDHRRFYAGFISLVAFGLPVLAAEEKPGGKSAPPEIPRPDARLLEAVKGLKAHPGYKVRMSVTGGLSDRADHAVTTLTVNDQYGGEVFQGVMSVTSSPTYPFKAFRTPKKGVSYVEGMWRPILAHLQGVRLDRLFAFPEDVLAQALKHSRTARWADLEQRRAAASEDEEDETNDGIAEDEDDAGDDEEVEEDEGDEDQDAEAKRRKTEVVKEDKASPKRLAMPRLILVEAPVKEALQHFLQVEKSGCISGG